METSSPPSGAEETFLKLQRRTQVGKRSGFSKSEDEKKKQALKENSRPAEITLEEKTPSCPRLGFLQSS